MIFQKMELNDIDSVLNIEEEVFRGHSPWPRWAFEQDLNNELADLIVLKNYDEIIGYYDVWYMFENADISNVAIKKEYQGKGYGRLLMNDLINRAILKEVEFLHLEVRVSNTRAVNLYKSLGFEEVRIRKGYYENGEDAIDMVKGLIGLNEESISD